MSAAGKIAFSRRGFLGASSAAAIGLAASGGAARSAPLRLVASTRRRSASEIAWSELQRRVSGPVLRPGSELFSWLSVPNNLRYSGTVPQGIVRCRSADDVAAAIKWARENDLPLVVRSGGHSYAGFSTTSGLMIETTLMAGHSFDPNSGVMTLQGGALNEQLYAGLRLNNVAITHGRCPTVGAAGFLLGGGIGFAMRMAGFASDHLVGSELVAADGRRLTLSATENPDLYWACRGGGGGNFGVNTSFSLKTFKVDRATVFQLIWDKKVPEVAAALMTVLDSAPNDLGSRLSIRAPTTVDRKDSDTNMITLSLQGQFQHAKPDDLLAILKPVYAIAEPSAAKSKPIEEKSYWDVQADLDDLQPPVYFREHSAFVNGPLSEQALQKGFEFLNDWPGTEVKGDLRFFQTGGVTRDLAPDATAFVHRQSNWLMVIGLYWNQYEYRDTVQYQGREWPRIDANLDWQSRFYSAMLPYAAGGAYQNFADDSLMNWRESYYGANYPKLERIKKDIDPDGVFSFKQAIGSVAAEAR